MSHSKHLSERIQRLSESATIKMAQMARDLKSKGHDVISLSLGEPDFDTPDHIKEAAKTALDDGFTKYTPVPGLVELREAIVAKFKRDNNLDFDINQIVVSNGAKQAIANICLALLNPGDEVIVLTPYWVSYVEIIKMAGGTPVPVSAGIENDFKISAQQLKSAITENTKMVLYSSPCNPTGSVYLEEEVKEMAEVLGSYENIFIVSDEIYEYINFTDKHASIGSFPEVKDRTITVNGFSKGFAMTGWRLGYMGAPAWIANACAKIQGQFTSGANAFGQKAAAFALNSDMGPTQIMKDAFSKRKDLVIELFSNIPGFKVNNPQGAFYIFPDVSYYFGKSNGELTIDDADKFSEIILQNAFVGLVSGSAFGDPNCIRISYAASEDQLKEAAKRIEEYLKDFH